MKTRSERRTTRHVGLTRDEVIDAALQIVEADGGDALSMRGLAARLDVAPTAVYWHVGNRDELVIEVIRRQAARQAETPVVGESHADRVHSAASNIWLNASTHRNVTALASQVGATTLLELPLEVALVAELEAAGLHGDRAGDALRSLLACIAGFLVLDWRSEQLVPDELRTATLWASTDASSISSDTRSALQAPTTPVAALFEQTLTSVVLALLNDVADEEGGR